MRLWAPGLERDDYRQEAAIAVWQGRNVNLHLIDVTKAATREKHRILSGACELEPEFHGGGRDFTLDTVMARDTLTNLAVAIRSLSPRERACLTRSANGATLEEIAAAERLTRKQVDNALTRARRALRTRPLLAEETA